MSEVIKMNINGRAYTLKEGRDFEVTETLSAVLRERLGFTGVRVSCNQGACGACTILLNGRSALSCMMLAIEADGCDITTIEGLPADDPVIKAFAEEADPGYGTAMQCGFCTPGFVLETKSLLAENPNPTPEEIREGLSGHVCRCGVYQGIEHAVEKVSKALYEAGGGQASDDKSEESAAAVPGGACSCQDPGGAGGGQASDGTDINAGEEV